MYNQPQLDKLYHVFETAIDAIEAGDLKLKDKALHCSFVYDEIFHNQGTTHVIPMPQVLDFLEARLVKSLIFGHDHTPDTMMKRNLLVVFHHLPQFIRTYYLTKVRNDNSLSDLPYKFPLVHRYFLSQ
jgi:hypothetical protein